MNLKKVTLGVCTSRLIARTQLILAQLVYLDFGPQMGVINKIYNLLHHELG